MPMINRYNELKNDNLSLNENSNFNETKTGVGEFIHQISERMKMMEKDIWVVDRFEGEYVICENRNTKEKLEIQKEKLPKKIKEGSVLNYKEGKFSIDLEEEKKIEDRIRKKMQDLWNE